MSRAADHAAVPHVIFTDPEIARVGLTEADAVSRRPGRARRRVRARLGGRHEAPRRRIPRAARRSSSMRNATSSSAPPVGQDVAELLHFGDHRDRRRSADRPSLARSPLMPTIERRRRRRRRRRGGAKSGCVSWRPTAGRATTRKEHPPCPRRSPSSSTTLPTWPHSRRATRQILTLAKGSPGAPPCRVGQGLAEEDWEPHALLPHARPVLRQLRGRVCGGHHATPQESSSSCSSAAASRSAGLFSDIEEGRTRSAAAVAIETKDSSGARCAGRHPAAGPCVGRAARTRRGSPRTHIRGAPASCPAAL